MGARVGRTRRRAALARGANARRPRGARRFRARAVAAAVGATHPARGTPHRPGRTTGCTTCQTQNTIFRELSLFISLLMNIIITVRKRT